MISDVDSFKAFSIAVESKARADADQVLAGAKRKAEAVRKQGREAAEKERADILARARQEAERVRSQAIASARMQAGMRKLESREKLLAEVFAAARQKLAEAGLRPDYERVIGDLIRDALSRLQTGAARIRTDRRARELLTEPRLDAISKETGVRLELGPALENSTGVIAETADGRRQFDNTLETRLNRMQDRLRALAFRLLSGESP
jgi:V/A-type H+-transporting ATPase subunit E